MSRYRLYPTPAQEAVLKRYCADARFVWNLGQEQRASYRPGRGRTPGFLMQSRQLTEARAAEPWLGAGSRDVQQQALRDLDQAWRNFFRGTHRRPTWRKAGRHEGFRVHSIPGKPHASWAVGRLNRHWGQVHVPKVGWVRFRWSRAVPECKSYRVTLDRSGRWHVAFAVIPQRIPGPGTGEIVGIDRGVAVSLAMSTGETLNAPLPAASTRRLKRRLSLAKPGSNRRNQARLRLARVLARDKDRRKDWAEKASTDIARRFDVIRIEDLRIGKMTRKPAPKPSPSIAGAFLRNGSRSKAGLNRAILESGWGLFARRLEDKASGRVEKVNPCLTSQRCSACGHVDGKSRKSQARFACTACGFTLNADLNAAINIAAGHAVTARGGPQLGPLNREPLAGAA